MATPQDVLFELTRALTLVEERPTGDPALVRALDRVREAQADAGWFVARVETGGLAVAGELLPDSSTSLRELRDVLDEARIVELRLRRPIDPETLERFLRTLRQASDSAEGLPSSRFRGLEDDLGLSFRKVRVPLPGMSGSIRRLFDGGETGESRSPMSNPSGSPVERLEPGTGPEAAWLDRLPEAMAADVLQFLRTTGEERRRAEDAVRGHASRLGEERAIVLLVALIGALCYAGADDGGDDGALSLARELTTPAVASHIVALLGSSREEAERKRLTKLTSLLGSVAALTLADALGEARDRSQRRVYMEAMAALGAVGLEVAMGMVEDPRWFVVRNGVSLLGEIGGEEAVAHITTALANDDSRVRKEAVLALARVGGESAGMLLTGMVDDTDPEVRAMACRALGVLRVERALKPLLRVLENDESHDVQVECLRALGHLGDPGAVPLIEKRAVGGLFSRPPRDIRIAAYRSLASIGTPHAMALLKKAVRDSDPGVRTTAQGLLSQG